MVSGKAQTDRRPDPDALLALTGREGRGSLKVFLGASPGVGKTFAMLQGAHRLKADGVDLVIGLVETHGRSETIALLDGLEVLPRRLFDYRGRLMKEFDLDAALERRPKLIVVDELANTNAPDSRHPKRWQDIEELLDAGIDVWTALNIQHLESLADIVSRITGIAVRETVPDTVLQSAADVVLVDITPDELISRLNEGKIYVPETARRATQNFFTPANLTALRELALRRTADRVDDQVVELARQKAIEGPYGSGERLLVCLGHDNTSERLVRLTSRLATQMNASWMAVHLHSALADQADLGHTKRIGEIAQLAERLGADVRHLESQNYTQDILALARQEHITQIVVGRAKGGWIKGMFKRSLAAELIRQSHDIGIHVVSADEEQQASRLSFHWPEKRQLGLELLIAAGSVSLAILVAQLLLLWVKLPNLSMIFLSAVLLCAVTFGTRSAVLAALFSFLGYNFFFIEPIYTFTIAEPHELFALLVFLGVAVLTGTLSGRARDHAQNVLKKAKITQSLYDFSRKLSAVSHVDDVALAAVLQGQRSLEGTCILLIPRDDDLHCYAEDPDHKHLDDAEMTAARWALSKAEAAGWGTGTLPKVRYQFRPLQTPRTIVGVFGYHPPQADPLSADQERVLTAIIEQTAIALDRALLVNEAVKAAALQENENIRDALLSSLSHDLRTPLASITGAVTGLQELGDQMSPDQRKEMLNSIEQEANRLSRFVNNLLDMSRIESGAIKIKQDWVDVSDVIRSALERSRKSFPEFPIALSLESGLPFIRGDAHLLEQVVFNLLDNAHKYAQDSGASVHARSENGSVIMSVTDEGPGIKPNDLARVFEKFYRGGRTDGRRAGTGLGLSICKGLVEAMSGSIQAQSPAVRRRGTRMIIRLPAAHPQGGAKKQP